MFVLAAEAPAPPLQPETSDVHLVAKHSQPQVEAAAAPSSKTFTALPRTGSSPDVIIEEIIEENPESE